MVCHRQSPWVCGYDAALPRHPLCGPPHRFFARGPRASTLPLVVRRPRQLPTVVFSDLTGLPLCPKYWDAWTTTHVFYCLRADNNRLSSSEARGAPLLQPPPPPRMWAARSVCLAHSDTGRSTSGHWTFVVWYPPGHHWVEPLTWEPRGGKPLLCCVNDREYARPFLGPRGSGAAGSGVVRAEGLVSDFKLFQASDPSARVIVESSSSPSGYGSRRLTARELGNLWDVPIIFLDSLPDSDVGALMGAICATPPSKLLHTGADLLLTDFFRGGRVGRARGKGSGEGRAGVRAAPAPGLRPLSDRELGIKRAAPPQDEVTPGKCPCVEVPPQDVPQVQVVSTAGEVSKGDSQKADNASVPDHLSDFADRGCWGVGCLGATSRLARGHTQVQAVCPEVLACPHDTWLHHLAKGERAPSSGRWGPDGSVPMASSHVPSVQMDRQGEEALPGRMADSPGPPRREGHGRGGLRCHTSVRQCNMV